VNSRGRRGISPFRRKAGPQISAGGFSMSATLEIFRFRLAGWLRGATPGRPPQGVCRRSRSHGFENFLRNGINSCLPRCRSPRSRYVFIHANFRVDHRHVRQASSACFPENSGDADHPRRLRVTGNSLMEPIERRLELASVVSRVNRSGSPDSAKLRRSADGILWLACARRV